MRQQLNGMHERGEERGREGRGREEEETKIVVQYFAIEFWVNVGNASIGQVELCILLFSFLSCFSFPFFFSFSPISSSSHLFVLSYQIVIDFRWI